MDLSKSVGEDFRIQVGTAPMFIAQRETHFEQMLADRIPTVSLCGVLCF